MCNKCGLTQSLIERDKISFKRDHKMCMEPSVLNIKTRGKVHFLPSSSLEGRGWESAFERERRERNQGERERNAWEGERAWREAQRGKLLYDFQYLSRVVIVFCWLNVCVDSLEIVLLRLLLELSFGEKWVEGSLGFVSKEEFLVV